MDAPIEINKLSEKQIDLLAQRFRILAQESRLKIINALFSGEKNVTEIIEATGLLQSNVSKQLKTLTKEGIIEGHKSGTNKYYRIIDETVRTICAMTCQQKNTS